MTDVSAVHEERQRLRLVYATDVPPQTFSSPGRGGGENSWKCTFSLQPMMFTDTRWSWILCLMTIVMHLCIL